MKKMLKTLAMVGLFAAGAGHRSVADDARNQIINFSETYMRGSLEVYNERFFQTVADYIESKVILGKSHEALDLFNSLTSIQALTNNSSPATSVLKKNYQTLVSLYFSLLSNEEIDQFSEILLNKKDLRLYLDHNRKSHAEVLFSKQSGPIRSLRKKYFREGSLFKDVNGNYRTYSTIHTKREGLNWVGGFSQRGRTMDDVSYKLNGDINLSSAKDNKTIVFIHKVLSEAKKNNNTSLAIDLGEVIFQSSAKYSDAYLDMLSTIFSGNAEVQKSVAILINENKKALLEMSPLRSFSGDRSLSKEASKAFMFDYAHYARNWGSQKEGRELFQKVFSQFDRLSDDPEKQDVYKKIIKNEVIRLRNLKSTASARQWVIRSQENLETVLLDMFKKSKNSSEWKSLFEELLLNGNQSINEDIPNRQLKIGKTFLMESLLGKYSLINQTEDRMKVFSEMLSLFDKEKELNKTVVEMIKVFYQGNKSFAGQSVFREHLIKYILSKKQTSPEEVISAINEISKVIQEQSSWLTNQGRQQSQHLQESIRLVGNGLPAKTINKDLTCSSLIQSLMAE